MAKGDILSCIEDYESQSLRGGELAEERAKNMDYYLGRPFAGHYGLDEIEGRSQVVSRDVADSVEWIKPSLLRIFTSGDDVVEFSPKGQEDIEAAQQESDYVNYIINQKNNWFTTAYTWFTDALIQKNGYVKCYWDETVDVTKETYNGLTADMFAFILQSPEVEVVGLEEFPAQPYSAPGGMAGMPGGEGMGGQLNPVMDAMMPPPPAMAPPMLYNVTVQKKQTYGCVKFVPIPPERTIVDLYWTGVSVQECPFIEHWEYKTLSQLREEGFDPPETMGDEATDTVSWTEENARNRFNEDATQEDGDAERKYRTREVWVRYDSDGDGISELRHVIVVGKTVLLEEECDLIPIASLTPRIMPHRHMGIGVADAVMDIQRIKSALQRSFLDNVYMSVNGRHGVDQNLVNLDDMLTNRPGGLVRTKGPPMQAIMPLATIANFAPVLEGITYFDSVREDRTGSSKFSQQLTPEILSKAPSGIAINQLMNASQALVELIARVFAETGVKDLFHMIHALTLKNSRQQEVVRLRNKWIPVDPRQWKTRVDMTVSVGLGTGNRDQQLSHYQMLLDRQLQLLPLGLATPQSIHHTATKMTQAMGQKDVAAFWPEPQQMKPPGPPPPDPVEMAKVKIEEFRAITERQKAAQDAQLGAGKLQIEEKKVVSDNANAARDRQVDATIDVAKLLAANAKAAAAPVPAQDDKRMEEVSKAAGATTQSIAKLTGDMAKVMQAVETLSTRRRKTVPVRDKRGKIVEVHEEFDDASPVDRLKQEIAMLREQIASMPPRPPGAV